MSLPYHVGFGIFGGLCPVIATYMIQKDNVKAKEAWTKLKEIDPSNNKAQKALESIK